MAVINIEGIDLHLTNPVDIEMNWVGQTEVVNQLNAAWLKVDEKDLPMNPRLIGKPGVGKTTLAYSVAKSLNRKVWFFQGTMDTRPEDLLISPVIDENQKIKYVASSLVSAMLDGGVCILDEGNRMSEKSWASLAPLLDHRRYIESIIAGIKVKAHDDFLFCTTMNEDSSTYEIPEYIYSRLQPGISIDFPSSSEERAILKSNIPFIDDKILDYVINFLQKAHLMDQAYTVRDGINLARYAFKLMKAFKIKEEEAFDQSLKMVLGIEV